MIAIVLVLCLVGALLLSPLGILFSGEENGGQTISSAVRELFRCFDYTMWNGKVSISVISCQCGLNFMFHFFSCPLKMIHYFFGFLFELL